MENFTSRFHLRNNSLADRSNEKPRFHFSYIVLCTLMEIPNILMILALVQTKRSKKITEKLFVILCIADIISLLFYFIIQVFPAMPPEPSHSVYMSAIRLTIMTIGNISQVFDTMVFLLITVLRYRSLVKPLAPLKTSFVYKLILAAGMISVLLPGTRVLSHMYGFKKRFFTALGGVFHFIVIILIVVINLMSFWNLRKTDEGLGIRLDSLRDHNHVNSLSERTLQIPRAARFQSNPRRSEERKSKQKKIQSVNTLLLITLFYVVCLLPKSIQVIFDKPSIHSLLSKVFGILVVANTTLNSITYMVRSKGIRRYYLQLLRKIKRKLF